MNILAPGSLLAQIRPANTTAATAVTGSVQNTEITRIVICNTTGTAATFRLFHDDDGSTYDQGSALYYDKSIAANDTFEWANESGMSGIAIAKDGTLGIRSGTADALNFSIYGVTARGR